MTVPDDTEGATYWRNRARSNERHWHTIYRSPLFVTLPAAIIVLLAANFVWEVVRANAHVDTTVSPWSLSVADLSTSAQLLAAFGGLQLARAQFARTVRPHFGYSWTQESGTTDRWDLHFYNGGPGHAQVIRVRYRVSFVDDDDGAASGWTGLADLESRLEAHAITGLDADLVWLGRAPAIPQNQSQDGFRLGRFSVRALALIDRLDVEILATDSVGDEHVLIIRSTARLPLRARQAIEVHRDATHP